MKTMLKLFPAATAILALALSITSLLSQPDNKRVELDHAVVMRRNQLEHELGWLKPENVSQAAELNRRIQSFVTWKTEWEEFAAAYRAYGALANKGTRLSADLSDDRLTSIARKKELQFKAVITQAIKPPTPDSQVILDANEVIQLAKLLIEIGWEEDVNLAGLLDERARHEEVQSPEQAAELRKLSGVLEMQDATELAAPRGPD